MRLNQYKHSTGFKDRPCAMNAITPPYPILFDSIKQELYNTLRFNESTVTNLSDNLLASQIQSAIIEVEKHLKFYIRDQIREADFDGDTFGIFNIDDRLVIPAGNVSQILEVNTLDGRILVLDTDYKVITYNKFQQALHIKLLKCFAKPNLKINVRYNAGFVNNDFSIIDEDLKTYLTKILAIKVINLYYNSQCSETFINQLKSEIASYESYFKMQQPYFSYNL